MEGGRPEENDSPPVLDRIKEQMEGGRPGENDSPPVLDRIEEKMEGGRPEENDSPPVLDRIEEQMEGGRPEENDSPPVLDRIEEQIEGEWPEEESLPIDSSTSPSPLFTHSDNSPMSIFQAFRTLKRSSRAPSRINSIDSARSTCSSVDYSYGGPHIKLQGSKRWLLNLGIGNVERPLGNNSESEVAEPVTLSAKQLGIIWGDDPSSWRWEQDKTSRFSEVAVLHVVCLLEIRGGIDSSQLSPQTTYEVYLIYKLGANAKGLGKPYHQKATIQPTNARKTEQLIYLDSNKLDVHPGRKGWNQIKMGKFYNGTDSSGFVQVRLLGSEGLHGKSGLMVEAMEFRAMKS